MILRFYYIFLIWRCESVIDPCLSSPCSNGYCSRAINQYSYACICNPGYTGPLCNILVNLCSDSLCKNSGLCVANGLSYNCVCLPGYTGFDCSFVVNQCYSNPCLNGGTCQTSGLGLTYMCICPNTFTGSNCQISN